MTTKRFNPQGAQWRRLGSKWDDSHYGDYPKQPRNKPMTDKQRWTIENILAPKVIPSVFLSALVSVGASSLNDSVFSSARGAAAASDVIKTLNTVISSVDDDVPDDDSGLLVRFYRVSAEKRTIEKIHRELRAKILDAGLTNGHKEDGRVLTIQFAERWGKGAYEACEKEFPYADYPHFYSSKLDTALLPDDVKARYASPIVSVK